MEKTTLSTDEVSTLEAEYVKTKKCIAQMESIVSKMRAEGEEKEYDEVVMDYRGYPLYGFKADFIQIISKYLKAEKDHLVYLNGLTSKDKVNKLKHMIVTDHSIFVENE